jgi:surface protein
MAKNNNLTDFLTDVADAIREKEGSANAINPQDFSDRIKALSVGGGDTPTPSRPTWTGHADAEGLRAIGWTEEDIAYYQENGVNWNAEDDQYHKVSEDNKALYGVLTADNIQTYKDRIVYLPRIDTSAKTSMYTMFYNCKSLVAIPHLDTSKVSNMSLMFSDCYSLVSIPHLDTSHVTNMSNMFDNCYSLVSIPHLDTSKVSNMSIMFDNCYSLVSIPHLDTSKVSNMSNMFYDCYSLVSIPHLDTSHVTNMLGMFYSCRSLASIPHLDTSNVKDMSNMLNCCYSLTHINLKNAKLTCELNNSALLSKDSLLYIINNEAAESAITIKLSAYAYQRLAEDTDIVAALTNHPNISIAQ